MNWFKLFVAIASVESGCDPEAVGDDGKALGLVQMHYGVIHDVNRFGNDKYSHLDALSVGKSYKIFYRYLMNWAQLLDLPATVENMAALWHLGPNNYNKGLYADYAKRVRNIYDTL